MSEIFSNIPHNNSLYYTISSSTMVASKFTMPFDADNVTTEAIFESINLWSTAQTNPCYIVISIHTDNAGVPGPSIGELLVEMYDLFAGSWMPFFTTALGGCINFINGQDYWISLKAADGNAEARWHHTANTFPFAVSIDGGETWGVGSGGAGTLQLFGEYIYATETSFSGTGLPLPGWSTLDLNQYSPSYNTQIGPNSFLDTVSLYYLANQC